MSIKKRKSRIYNEKYLNAYATKFSKNDNRCIMKKQLNTCISKY